MIAHTLDEIVRELTLEHDETWTEGESLTQHTVTRRVPALLDLLRHEADHATVPGSGRTIADSRTPGRAALDLLVEIKRDSRALLESLDHKPRGSTAGCVRLLATLREPAIDDRIRGWHTAARIAVGLDPAPIELPVHCPYCAQLSITASRTVSEAWCSTRGCLDAAGQRPVWTGEAELALLGRATPTAADA